MVRVRLMERVGKDEFALLFERDMTGVPAQDDVIRLQESLGGEFVDFRVAQRCWLMPGYGVQRVPDGPEAAAEEVTLVLARAFGEADWAKARANQSPPSQHTLFRPPRPC